MKESEIVNKVMKTALPQRPKDFWTPEQPPNSDSTIEDLKRALRSFLQKLNWVGDISESMYEIVVEVEGNMYEIKITPYSGQT